MDLRDDKLPGTRHRKVIWNFLSTTKSWDKYASSVISVLKSIFVRSGIPYTFLANNVPCNSQELNIFSKQYNFLLKTSGSNYFQSTRLNEMNVIIAKKKFKKYKDPGLGLLGYHNTSITGMSYSPSQLLMIQSTPIYATSTQ